MKKTCAAFAGALLAVGAFAQSPEPGSVLLASVESPTAGQIKRGQELESHIRDLHTRLKITQSEESTWTDVVIAMRESARELDAAIDKREQAVAQASAPDNLSAYGDIAQAHADGVRQLAAAFAPLYAAMPADQKKVADAIFAHRKQVEQKPGKQERPPSPKETP